MKPILILYLFILCKPGFSSDANTHVKDTTDIEHKNILTLAPLPLLDVINPAFQIGYERLIRDKLGIQFEGGPIIKRSLIGYFFTGLGFGTEGAWWTNSGYKLRSELKLYITQKNNLSFRSYFSSEFFITRNTSRVTQLFLVSDSTFDYSKSNARFAGDGVYDDFYSLKKIRRGVNIKYGINDTYENNITIDGSVGLGIVYQEATEKDRANMQDKPFDGNWPFLNSGPRLIPNLTCSIKIGYRF